MGAAYFQTPRDTVKDFVGLLGIVEQNPGARWQDDLGACTRRRRRRWTPRRPTPPSTRARTRTSPRSPGRGSRRWAARGEKGPESGADPGAQGDDLGRASGSDRCPKTLRRLRAPRPRDPGGALAHAVDEPPPDPGASHEEILGRDRHVIDPAETAGGKTEAAFLPIIRGSPARRRRRPCRPSTSGPSAPPHRPPVPQGRGPLRHH